ncbi:RHS repeat-associated core domain-containing protein [Tahibacter soli]|uniref:Transglutaminase domain-containing protein n=1 Tax=Tahibacter soli TaxID=2983605 RepID=A0A9X4BIA1_9GAMM|nr:RHS repeat-associated core domain-containing protein [Tahibacter soli]MDC8013721.1 transglutaminase domain-containing protein [Tahibacter soli]
MLRNFVRSCALAVAAAGATCAVAANGTAPASASQRAVAALLAGQDARAAVAQALAQASPAKSALAGADRGALAGYARALADVGRAIDAARASGAGRAALASALASLDAHRLLVEARLGAIDRLFAERGGAPSRWPQQRAAIVAQLARVATAAASAGQALAAGDARTAVPHAALAELADLAAANADENRAPIHGANLPVHRPRLPTREPAAAPVVVPAYANAAQEIEPVAADYAATPDAPLSPEILAKAESLGRDYARIVDFVRGEVRTQWYAGAQKGAIGTLRSLSGNDVDQASLLVALLRASRAPARYVEGVVEVPVADLAASLAVRADKVGQALSAAGVANRPVARGGRIAAYAIEHVFVTAQLPLSNYRGTSADRDGETWVPLAPALKPYRFVPARGALAAANIAARAFADEYVRAPQPAAPLDALRERVTHALAQASPPLAYDDQLALHALDAPPLGLVPASLPATALAIVGEYSELPDRLRQRVQVVVRDADGAAALDATLPLVDLVDRRVTLAYEPASIEDGNLADRYGGLGNAPPSLVAVRPVLNIAGRNARTGGGTLETGSRHRVEVTIAGPGGATSFAQDLTAGGLAALVFDVHADGPALEADGAVLPGDSENPAARLLANVGARYLAAWDAADAELARLAGVGVVRPFPSAALVINRYAIARVGGVIDAMPWDGVSLDASLRPAEAFAGVADNRAEADFTELSALHGSSLEHRVFEQQWAVDSVSADKALALAAGQNVPVLQLTGATGVAGLNQPAEVKDAIAAWLARGYVVDVPRDPVAVQSWRGAAWRVRALATGESGWFIAGGLAGGATAMPPALWYLQELVDILGNAYGEPPNDDPFAGAILSIDRDAQDQEGEADTLLPKALRAIVADENGRPVRGAEVVFHVAASGSKFVGENDVEVDEIAARTDGKGVASVRLKLAQSQGAAGRYMLTPGDEFPQWQGSALVEVRARARRGVLASGEAYRAWILPAAAQDVRFTYLEDGERSLTPNIGYRPGLAEVRDRFGNAIANRAIRLTTATSIAPGPCGLGVGSPTGASLFKPQQCPADAIHLTGAPCASTSIDVVSRPGGAPFFLVPPATAPATVTLQGASGGAAGSLRLHTDPAFEICNDDLLIFMVATSTWGHRLGPTAWPTTVLEAARPNQPIPVAKQVNAYYMRMPRTFGQVTPDWLPVSGGQLEFWFGNGTGTNARPLSTPGAYSFDIVAGPDPGEIDGRFYVLADIEGRRRSMYGHTTAWVVDPKPPTVAPDNIGLTPFSTTDANLRLGAGFAPLEYVAAPLRIELLKNGEVLDECGQISADGNFFCTYLRGMGIDNEAEYAARTVLNDGTPFRMQSQETPIRFGQNIIAGYGRLPSDVNDPLDLVRIVQGYYPTSIPLRTEIDVPTGWSCGIGERLGFLLARAATVSLEFRRLQENGDPAGTAMWQPIRDEARDEGLHEILLDTAHLPPGEYQYRLKAVAADGTVEEYAGNASSRLVRRDALPLAHSLVKGVDTFSGNASLSEQDIVLGGRGPGLRIVRTYASHQGGEEPGAFGRGWSADLDNQVIATGCNERIVTGSAGQGQRFRAIVGPDGATRFEALHGYHGTLVQRGLEYDFYTKDGTRYHFGGAGVPGARLAYIEDVNGNRVSYTWQFDIVAPRVTRIADAAGRQIDLAYKTVVAERRIAGTTLRETLTLVDAARGPDGLVVRYEYDANGNLSKAVRSDASGKGERVSAYTYRDFGGRIVTQPDGELTYTYFGYRLTGSRDASSNDERRYDYDQYLSVVPNGNAFYYAPEQRAISVRELDGGTTRFAYDGLRGAGPVRTTVTDPRDAVSTFSLNGYGAAETIVDPAGTTTTQWDLVALQPKKIVDALATEVHYTYDVHGNRTTEEIRHASGTRTRGWTYVDPAEFDAPYIRNRVDRFTDARQIVTDYGYDRRGNLTTTARGGVTQTDAYDDNGDRTSRTDGRTNVWKFRYDRYGHVTETEDPLAHVVKTEYDARGRKTAETSSNGGVTTYAYDARDRTIRTSHPATAAGLAVETTVYDDVRRERTFFNARGKTTRTTFDPMGRVYDEVVEAGTRSLRYDANGNLESETDRGGHVVRMEYDAANRLRKKFEPENRTTLYDVDALGHVVRETVGERIAEYRYDDAQYRRTTVRRWLAGAAGGRFVEETTRYDGNGNAIASVDALLRETTRTFDDRDRLKVEAAPLGRVATFAYDGADNKVEEVRENPGGSGAQRRTFGYDAANRLVATTDAEGRTRTTVYDANGNAVEMTNARGHTVRKVYDARDNVVEESGPEIGQRTTYRYDLNGNKVEESRANGRVLTYTHDALDRLERTDDADGLVEKRKLDADGLVEALTDADNRTTISTYDDLHRVETKTLPGPGPRTTRYAYNVHGDVELQTDARNHATATVYDTLGRRVETRHPEVDGVTAVETTGYDDAGNIVATSNGRGHVTDYSFNALNLRVGQTDPADAQGRRFEQTWTYDALGNALTHTDRRGILAVTAYDRENRVVGRARDGLVLETLTLDEEGNVSLLRDALGRETATTYDRANRKLREARPLGAVSTWTYEPEGDVAETTDADGRTTSHTYTKRRHLETQTLAGETTTHRYNGSGQRIATLKPERRGEWLYGYDAGGRLETVESPLHHVTRFGYDAADNRTSILDANAHETTFAYDARNRLAGKTYEGGDAYAWTYDADGNRTRTTTPNGVAIDATYDALDRAIDTTYAGAATGEVGKTSRGYDGNGNIVAVTEEFVGGAARTQTRRYDDFERLEHIVDVHGGTLGYRYDAVGNRTHLVDRDGRETVWTYDALNHNDAVTVPGQGTTTQTHTKVGLIDVVTRPDGTTSDTDYDPAGRISRVAHAKAGATLATSAYRYDFNGNRVEQKETNGAATGGIEIVTAYGYDADDRLETVTEPARATTYTLDPVGNRVRERVAANGTTIGDSTLVYDARDRLTSRSDPTAGVAVAQTYDANGNLKTQVVNGGAPRTYTYDARDRMTALHEGAATPFAFDYDADGLRIAKSQGMAQATRYQYDLGSLIAEANASGSTLVRYHYSANQLIGRTQAGSTPVERHYLLDALRTPIAMLTQAGAVDARTRYDAWGEVIAQQGTSGQTIAPAREGAHAALPSTDEQPIGFTGYYKDGESGLYYAKARYYDPAVARFMSEDPEAGNDMTPPSLHRYLYAHANPTVYVDPTGRYGEAGHYYTTYYVALRMGYSDADAQQLAFYSQLPDEAAALDAMYVVKAKGFNLTSPERWRTNEEIQELLHGLNGGIAEHETGRTLNALKSAGGDLTTSGLLIHRLADSFAHRKTELHGGEHDPHEQRMFTTNIGHLTAGYSPDTIQRQPELYLQYVRTLAGALGEKRNLSAEQIGALQTLVAGELSEVAYMDGKLPREGFFSRGFFGRDKDAALKERSMQMLIHKLNMLGIERIGSSRTRPGLLDMGYRPEDRESFELLSPDLTNARSIDHALGDIWEGSALARDNASRYRRRNVDAALENVRRLLLKEHRSIETIDPEYRPGVTIIIESVDGMGTLNAPERWWETLIDRYNPMRRYGPSPD